jgi:hypothetical protein
MPRIIKHLEAHYETHEVPFARSYEWHPEHIIVECDCGHTLTLTGTSATTACGCGIDYGALVHGIHYSEEHLRDEEVHPWHYDLQSQAEQHLEDEAAHPRNSSWRYNDVTSGLVGDDEERWKKARAQQEGL